MFTNSDFTSEEIRQISTLIYQLEVAVSKTVHLTEDEDYKIIDGYIKTDKLDNLREQLNQLLHDLDKKLKQ